MEIDIKIFHRMDLGEEKSQEKGADLAGWTIVGSLQRLESIDTSKQRQQRGNRRA